MSAPVQVTGQSGANDPNTVLGSGLIDTANAWLPTIGGVLNLVRGNEPSPTPAQPAAGTSNPAPSQPNPAPTGAANPFLSPQMFMAAAVALLGVLLVFVMRNK